MCVREPSRSGLFWESRWLRSAEKANSQPSQTRKSDWCTLSDLAEIIRAYENQIHEVYKLRSSSFCRDLLIVVITWTVQCRTGRSAIDDNVSLFAPAFGSLSRTALARSSVSRATHVRLCDYVYAYVQTVCTEKVYGGKNYYKISWCWIVLQLWPKLRMRVVTCDQLVTCITCSHH